MMLTDLMVPLMLILEDNQCAPMAEAICWEQRLAENGRDATVREVYADRLAEWGCRKREDAVRRQALAIRAGAVVSRPRWSFESKPTYGPEATGWLANACKLVAEWAEPVLVPAD